MTIIRLVNCPICGARTSADKISCPECDFEIQNYFNSETVKKPHPIRFKLSFIISTAILCIL